MMNKRTALSSSSDNQRSFSNKGIAVGTTTTVGAAPLTNRAPAFAQQDRCGSLPKGDAAILRFLAAAEIIESDLWLQYNELGGIQDNEVPGGSGNAAYTAALRNLDRGMNQYIHDNADNEFSHWSFLNAYLDSKGADAVNLDEFRTLPSSKASGAQNIGRLTNLMQLTIDTSWYTRYRSRHNPDLEPCLSFPQAVPGLAKGHHPAIPRDDSDLTPQNHLQAIANTAGFHFAFVEQGVTSLYFSLAQNVRSPEVLRILLSIGPTEMAQFQTWHDKAGNAVNGSILPVPFVDPKDPTLVFSNLNSNPGGPLFQTKSIMPEPCQFVSRDLPRCSIVRPQTKGAAMAAVNAFTGNGLFIGHRDPFFDMLLDLATDADAAVRDN